LDDSAWLTCSALKEFEPFEKLTDDLVGSAKRFREWFELEHPEVYPKHESRNLNPNPKPETQSRNPIPKPGTLAPRSRNLNPNPET